MGDAFFTGRGVAGMAWEVKPYPEWSWSHSRDLDEWWTAPKRKKMLFEMFYFRKLPAALIVEIRERMQRCLTHFLESKSLREIIVHEDCKLTACRSIRSRFARSICCRGNARYRRLMSMDWSSSTARSSRAWPTCGPCSQMLRRTSRSRWSRSRRPRMNKHAGGAISAMHAM